MKQLVRHIVKKKKSSWIKRNQLWDKLTNTLSYFSRGRYCVSYWPSSSSISSLFIQAKHTHFRMMLITLMHFNLIILFLFLFNQQPRKTVNASILKHYSQLNSMNASIHIAYSHDSVYLTLIFRASHASLSKWPVLHVGGSHFINIIFVVLDLV